MPADQILTIPQIAQLTNRTVDTVRYWRLHGNGPKTFRSNNRVYAYKSESLARKGETMTIAAMATYAYDQIDQARAELDHPS